jgi:hypothetical protein
MAAASKLVSQCGRIGKLTSPLRLWHLGNEVRKRTEGRWKVMVRIRDVVHSRIRAVVVVSVAFVVEPIRQHRGGVREHI